MNGRVYTCVLKLISARTSKTDMGRDLRLKLNDGIAPAYRVVLSFGPRALDGPLCICMCLDGSTYIMVFLLKSDYYKNNKIMKHYFGVHMATHNFEYSFFYFIEYFVRTCKQLQLMLLITITSQNQFS